MLAETSFMLGRMSDEDLLQMKDCDSSFHYTHKFYMLMVSARQFEAAGLTWIFASHSQLSRSSLQGAIVYWSKPELMPFIACRIVKLSLEHGIFKDSILGFLQYSAILCQQTKPGLPIDNACRVGKVAMKLLDRFDSSDLIARTHFCYYGVVATHTEPLQHCTDQLRKGFEGT